MNNNEKIEIGAVAKPQGIKGELKVRLFADDFAAVKDIKTVEIKPEDPDSLALLYISPVITLIGICDREPDMEAECLDMLDKHIKLFFDTFGGGRNKSE